MKRNRICRDCGATYLGSQSSSYCAECRTRRYKENGLRTAERAKDNKQSKAAPKRAWKVGFTIEASWRIIGLFIALWSIFGVMCYIKR